MRMKTINIYEEASRCMLCLDAPCTKACKTGDPARAIRAIRFDNHKPAMRWVKDCSDADLERAEQACVHYNWPIRIKEILRSISPDAVEFIQLGCNNVQVCTAVMQYGYRIIDDLILGLQRYMAKRNITRLQDLVGEQLPSFIKPDHLNRDTIIYPKIDKEQCVGCHLCRLVCPTGAIGLTKRIPKKSLGKTD